MEYNISKRQSEGSIHSETNSGSGLKLKGSKQSHIKVHFKGIIAKVQCQRFKYQRFVSCLAFVYNQDCPQGYLVSGSGDSTVRLWDHTSGLLLHTCEVGSQVGQQQANGTENDYFAITDLCATPDGSSIFVAVQGLAGIMLLSCDLSAKTLSVLKANEPQEPVAAGRWLPVEEELLATCYVAVSEDNNVGRSQKHDTFWYRFNAAYKRAKRLWKSGENNVDYLKRAQSIYRDEHRGVAFFQEDAWAVLRFHPKWDAPEQVDLTGVVPGASQEDLFGHDARPRPPDKQWPAKKSKSDATASTDGSSASAQFGELMEQELRLKREAAERAFEAQAEKDRTLMRLDELRFLATSTKDLDEDDAYWIKKQKKLIKNKIKNDFGDEDDEDEDE
ncbi:glutathione S-transferase T3-like protein [Tanacetum coccineum]